MLRKKQTEAGMCGRYLVDEKSLEMRAILEEVARRYEGQGALPLRTGEIRPSQVAPVQTQAGWSVMKWGFDRWDRKGLIINARAETLGQKPMFKKSLAQYRCLVPVSGYYEWTQDKQKILFEGQGQSVLYLAGLYRPAQQADQVDAYVVITRDAAQVDPRFAKIHDRMPAVLRREDRLGWLQADGEAAGYLSCDIPPLSYAAVAHAGSNS